MEDVYLVADIGGTNARFALVNAEVEPAGQGISLKHFQTYSNAEFSSLTQMVEAYLKAVKIIPVRSCFALAAPVIKGGGHVATPLTNGGFVYEPRQVGALLKGGEVRLVNDFEGLAAGVAYLPKNGTVRLKPGRGVPMAPILVLGPGTGFGQALVLPRQAAGEWVVATQGGHVAFSPANSREIALLQYFRKYQDYISVEFLLSGDGLARLYQGLCTLSGVPEEDSALEAAMITEIAHGGVGVMANVAREAIGIFWSILGGVAGDAVLATGARGGVFLAGGMPLKMMNFLPKSDFFQRFSNKGKMNDWLEGVPIHLINQPGAALYGAATLLRQT